MSVYTCALCGYEGERLQTETWNSEKMEAKFETDFTPEERALPRDEVCEDCYKAVIARWNALTPAEKDAVRREFGS